MLDGDTVFSTSILVSFFFFFMSKELSKRYGRSEGEDMSLCRKYEQKSEACSLLPLCTYPSYGVVGLPHNLWPASYRGHAQDFSSIGPSAIEIP
jgi:hypothetical protein